MRMMMLLASLAMSACSSAVATVDEPIETTVREQLAHPTHLAATPGTSGAISAQRWSRDGWIGGDVPLVIENGGMDASVEPDGRITIRSLQLSFAPIEIPEGTIGAAARLDHLQLEPVALPAPATATWLDDDTATATTRIDLALDWAVTIDGVSASLGPLDLPPLDAHLALRREGDGRVGLAFDLGLDGLVWDWFSVIQLRDLHLQIELTSRD